MPYTVLEPEKRGYTVLEPESPPLDTFDTQASFRTAPGGPVPASSEERAARDLAESNIIGMVPRQDVLESRAGLLDRLRASPIAQKLLGPSYQREVIPEAQPSLGEVANQAAQMAAMALAPEAAAPKIIRAGTRIFFPAVGAKVLADQPATVAEISRALSEGDTDTAKQLIAGEVANAAFLGLGAAEGAFGRRPAESWSREIQPAGVPIAPLPEYKPTSPLEREFKLLHESWLPTQKPWRQELLKDAVAKGTGTENIDTNFSDAGYQATERAKRYYHLARALYGREGEQIPVETKFQEFATKPIQPAGEPRYAPQERQVQESRQPEYQRVETQRLPAEAGGGNRPVGSPPSEVSTPQQPPLLAKVEPPPEPQPTPEQEAAIAKGEAFAQPPSAPVAEKPAAPEAKQAEAVQETTVFVGNLKAGETFGDQTVLGNFKTKTEAQRVAADRALAGKATSVEGYLNGKYKRGWVTLLKQQPSAPSPEQTPAQVLAASPAVRITPPEGATQIRITDKSGRTSVMPVAALNKNNTFQGVDIAKVEAGKTPTYGPKKGKFEVVKGDIKVEPAMLGMGGAVPGEFEGGTGADIYGIAQRVREERAKAGVTLPIEPGQGVSAVEAIEHGREVLGKDPQAAQKAIDEFGRSRGVSYDGLSAVRAKGEEASRAARRIEEKFGTDSPEYRTAFEAAFQWEKASKAMQTEWHKTGRAQQGETDIDTGSVTGMQMAHKTATGKDFTPEQMETAKKLAGRVKVAAADADAARQKLYDQLDLALQGIDVAPPKDIAEARMLFAKFAEGDTMTPQQIKTLWNAAKKFYLDAGETDFDTIRHGLAADFGISVKTVTEGLAMPKGTKTISNEMYARMADRRRVIGQARAWVKNQQTPGWLRFIRVIPRVFFVDKIFGHGTVGMITHAGLNIFNPTAWRTYWPAFIKQYGLVFKPSYHERMMQDLVRDPNFITAKRAGLVNDPFRYADDYQNATMRLFMGKLGGLIGGRGFDSLKLFRQARFNQIWNDLPESLRTPDMAKVIATSVNHATGVVKTQFREWSNWVFFAPKLEASRWAWMFRDPMKAGAIFKEWHNATPEERAFALSQVKEKAVIAGTYFGLLALNQGLLSASGSDQKINFTDPKRGDYLSFKVLGHNIGVVGPMLGMVRLLRNLIHDSIGKRGQVESLTPRGAQFGETLGSYARGKLSPFAGAAYNVAAQSDFQGRPLPFSSDKVPAYLRRRGLGKYTTGEYLAQELAPIPVEEAIREVWADMGMNESQINTYLKAITIGVVAGGTGARVSRDYPKPEAQTNAPIPQAFQQ